MDSILIFPERTGYRAEMVWGIGLAVASLIVIAVVAVNIWICKKRDRTQLQADYLTPHTRCVSLYVQESNTDE